MFEKVLFILLELLLLLLPNITSDHSFASASHCSPHDSLMNLSFATLIKGTTNPKTPKAPNLQTPKPPNCCELTTSDVCPRCLANCRGAEQPLGRSLMCA